MTQTEFIAELRAMADDLEKGSFHFTHLADGESYIFGNRNYGEVSIKLNQVTSVSVNLYRSTDEEREAHEAHEE